MKSSLDPLEHMRVKDGQIKTNNMRKLVTTKMRMPHVIHGISMLEYILNGEIRRVFNLPSIDEMTHSGRLRWFWHVHRREEYDVARCQTTGRLRKTWKQQIREDTRELVVTVEITLDHMEWRMRSRPMLWRQGYGPSR